MEAILGGGDDSDDDKALAAATAVHSSDKQSSAALGSGTAAAAVPTTTLAPTTTAAVVAAVQSSDDDSVKDSSEAKTSSEDLKASGGEAGAAADGDDASESDSAAESPSPPVASRPAMRAREPPHPVKQADDDDDAESDALLAKMKGGNSNSKSKRVAVTASDAHSQEDAEDDLTSSRSQQKKVMAPMSDDADGSAEAEAVSRPAPAPPSLPSDDEGSEDTAPPAPSRRSAKKQARKASAKQDGFTDGKVSQLYSAWSPNSDDAPAAPKKSNDLQQMLSDFDSDDDSTPTPAPPPRRHRRHASLAQASPAPPPQPASDGIVYDDDDLPKHHPKPITMDLSGGWKSFLKRGAGRKAKAKLDPDVAVMQSLYSSDGGLPSQYSAWKPSSANAPSLPKEDPTPKAADVKTNAPSLDSDSDDDGAASFLQIASKERVALRADASQDSAALIVLAQYAEVLQSQPLRHLAQARLSPAKLTALWQRLEAVDPLTHPNAVAAKGKQAQAEQWCVYFQRHEQAATPVRQAAARVENASSALAELSSSRAAMAEEVDARTQLEKTVEQDVQSLSTLLELARQGEEVSRLRAAAEGLASGVNGMSEELMSLGASVEAIQEGQVQLADALQAAMERRKQALEAQSAKLAELQQEEDMQQKELLKKKNEVSRRRAEVASAQKSIAGIQTSCDATLESAEKRKRVGHMEVHAIETALKVLDNQ
jgi:hypothetical protein